MIRINLLSDREAVRRESSRQEVSIFFLSVCLLLVILGAVHFRMYQKRRGMEEDIRKVNKALTELQTRVGKVEEFKAAKQELETKLAVIDRLEAGKLWVPRMLDSLGGAMPEKMWVEKIAMRGNSLSLEGFAIDHETVARFMQSLDSSPCFHGVELLVTEKKEVAGVGMKSFSIVTQTDPQPAGAKGAAPSAVPGGPGNRTAVSP